MHRAASLLRVYFLALTALPCFAHAFVVYHSPNDDGVNPGGVANVPIGAGSTALHLYVDNGTSPTPVDPCSGSGVGDEVCMWDLHISCDPGLTIVGFNADPGAEVVANPQPSFIRFNGGEPLSGTLGPSRIGQLTVAASGAGDCDVVGEAWVDTGLNANPVSSALVSACEDGDADQICNVDDACPSFALVDPTDSNTDGIPDECQCGDYNNSGTLDNGDLFSVFNCVSGASSPATCAPLLAKGEANNSGTWDNGDLFSTFGAVSGAAPAYTLTCANRPEGTPPP